MPRRGKGSKVPKIDAPMPQHGQRQALQESQAQTPPGENPLTQMDPIALAEQAAQAGGVQPAVGLQNDNLPVTSGIDGGPGAGPEALFPRGQGPARVSDQLDQMASILDDSHLMQLAQMARQRGL